MRRHGQTRVKLRWIDSAGRELFNLGMLVTRDQRSEQLQFVPGHDDVAPPTRQRVEPEPGLCIGVRTRYRERGGVDGQEHRAVWEPQQPGCNGRISTLDNAAF